MQNEESGWCGCGTLATRRQRDYGAAQQRLPYLGIHQGESDFVRPGPTASDQKSNSVGPDRAKSKLEASEIDFGGGFGIFGEDEVRCFRKGKRRSPTQSVGLL